MPIETMPPHGPEHTTDRPARIAAGKARYGARLARGATVLVLIALGATVVGAMLGGWFG